MAAKADKYNNKAGESMSCLGPREQQEQVLEEEATQVVSEALKGV